MHSSPLDATARGFTAMNNRDWFCLALRLLGIWILIQAVETILPYLFSMIGGGEFYQAFVFTFLWVAARTTIGLVLLLFAPAITARFYPSTESTETMPLGFDETRLLKVGIQLLAVYALLLGVQSGASVILGFLASVIRVGKSMGPGFSGSGSEYLRSLLNLGLNFAFAAILLMWNDRIAAFIAKFRYIPERDAYEPPPISD